MRGLHVLVRSICMLSFTAYSENWLMTSRDQNNRQTFLSFCKLNVFFWKIFTIILNKCESIRYCYKNIFYECFNVYY